MTSLPIEPIDKPASLSDAVVRRIRELISAGELGRGDQLPPEMELGEAFGVGRSSIREAIQALEALGMVEVVHGRGTFVSTDWDGTLVEPLSWSDLPDQEQIQQLLEARLMIEVPMASLAAERVTSEDVQSMEKLLDKVDAPQPLPFLERTVTGDDFHAAIAAATRNLVVITVYNSIRQLYHATMGRLVDPAWAWPPFQSHRPIFEALAERNPEVAEQAMHEHLLEFAQIVSDLVDREQSE